MHTQNILTSMEHNHDHEPNLVAKAKFLVQLYNTNWWMRVAYFSGLSNVLWSQNECHAHTNACVKNFFYVMVLVGGALIWELDFI